MIKSLILLAMLVLVALTYPFSASAVSCTEAFNRCAATRTKGGDTAGEIHFACSKRHRGCMSSGCWRMRGGKRVCNMEKK